MNAPGFARHPPPSSLRWFAAIWLVWFTGFAGMAWILGDSPLSAWVLLGVAALVGSIGLARPRLIRPLFVGSLVITTPIGWLVSRLLLVLVFSCLFTPIGLFFRLIGRDALNRQFDPNRESYWSPKQTARNLRSYFHMS